ncbi:hypothetical protein ACQEU6_08350 [Spirillospora sp. CA-108201]
MTHETDAPAVPGAEVGERVVLTTASGRARHAGVLLPPVKAGEPHRVHTDTGKVLRLDGRWLAAPERSTAERRKDRRVQYCAQGRPVYRPDDLFSLQLATKTMLRTRLRRRAAEGQQPIASYKVYGGKNYAPLYAVADTERMPPLSPARQAAWDQARTCARCRTTQATPFAKGPDARRYCERCHEPAARDWWAVQRTEGRRAARAWSRGVLDGLPNVVLLKATSFTGSFEVQAETLDGTVLVAAKLRDPRCTIPEWWTDEMRQRIAGRYTPIAEVLEPLRALEGCRLVTWRGGVERLQQCMRQYADVDLPLAVEDDQAAPHYDEWIGEPITRTHGYRYAHRLALQAPPGGWENHVAGIRAAVQTMAASEAPPLFTGEPETGRG